MLVCWEMEGHFALFEDEAFDAEVASDAPECDGEDEFLCGLRDGSEAVDELLSVLVELLFGGEVVELFVELQAFADVGDVVVGDEHFEVGFDSALLDERKAESGDVSIVRHTPPFGHPSPRGDGWRGFVLVFAFHFPLFAFRLKEFGEVGGFEFVDGFVEDFVVHIVAYFADESALFGAEDVAGASDVEVAHSDVESAADGGEFFDGAEALLCVVGQRAE